MRRHDLDVFSLIAGLVILVVGVTFVVAALNDAGVPAPLLGPAVLIGLGAAGLAGSVRMARRGDRQETQPLLEPTATTHAEESSW